MLETIPHGSLAKTVLASGVGSDAPIFDTAFTRNLYSFFVVKSVTSKNKGESAFTSPTFVHPPSYHNK